MVCRLRDVAVIVLEGSEDELTLEDRACLGQGDTLADQQTDKVLKLIA